MYPSLQLELFDLYRKTRRVCDELSMFTPLYADICMNLPEVETKTKEGLPRLVEVTPAKDLRLIKSPSGPLRLVPPPNDEQQDIILPSLRELQEMVDRAKRVLSLLSRLLVAVVTLPPP